MKILKGICSAVIALSLIIVFAIPFIFEAETIGILNAVIALLILALIALISFALYIICEHREEKHAEERELKRRIRK